MFGSFYICNCVSTILFVYVSNLNRKTCYIRLVYCSDHLHMYKKLDFESIDSVVVFCGYFRGFFRVFANWEIASTRLQTYQLIQMDFPYIRLSYLRPSTDYSSIDVTNGI